MKLTDIQVLLKKACTKLIKCCIKAILKIVYLSFLLAYILTLVYLLHNVGQYLKMYLHIT